MSISHSSLRDQLDTHAPLFTGWTMWPSADVAEALGRSPFGAVLIDMQHGGIGFEYARHMTAAVAFAGKPAIVRIPIGDFATASRALDFGAQAIVAPMVNSVEEAIELVKSVKYAPIGERSYGPFRARQLYRIESGNDYIREGNRTCLAFAMIETQEAVANLDAILAVDGIDGIYVGPTDLSLTIFNGEQFDLEDEASNAICEQVCKTTKAAGKVAGIYAPDTYFAKKYAGFGFDLISVSSDISLLADGVSKAVKELGIEE